MLTFHVYVVFVVYLEPLNHNKRNFVCVNGCNNQIRFALLPSVNYSIKIRASGCKQNNILQRSRLKFGERALNIAASKAWDTLPLNVRQTSNTQTFKRRLKTFLFCKSYNIPIPTIFCVFYLLYFIALFYLCI